MTDDRSPRHDYLSAGDNPYTSGNERYHGCSLCGLPRSAHRDYKRRMDDMAKKKTEKSGAEKDAETSASLDAGEEEARAIDAALRYTDTGAPAVDQPGVFDDLAAEIGRAGAKTELTAPPERAQELADALRWDPGSPAVDPTDPDPEATLPGADTLRSRDVAGSAPIADGSDPVPTAGDEARRRIDLGLDHEVRNQRALRHLRELEARCSVGGDVGLRDIRQLIALLGALLLCLFAACSTGARSKPEPATCVPLGSVCSSITPCCTGLCTKVGSAGTRYDWQCR